MKAIWDIFYPCVDKPKRSSTASFLFLDSYGMYLKLYLLPVDVMHGCFVTHMQCNIWYSNLERGAVISSNGEKRHHNLLKKVAIYIYMVQGGNWWYRFSYWWTFLFHQVQSSCVHLSIGAIIYLDLCTSCWLILKSVRKGCNRSFFLFCVRKSE